MRRREFFATGIAPFVQSAAPQDAPNVLFIICD